ncbi:MAG TPA: TetR/AcrR family transcriptional regulator [Nocardioidaceae bacterium]|nr:TetR/AcrR family transcriptional regulator [Nocardioidaceae bacterium]
MTQRTSTQRTSSQRTSNQRAVAKLRTREALLDAALVVMAQHGYHGSRLDVIAKEAGHTTGAVYASFTGKDDLFAVLANRETSRFVDALGDAALSLAGSVEDRTRRVISAYLAYLEARPEFFAIAFELSARARHDDGMRGVYAEQRALITAALAMMLEEGARASDRELVLPARQIATVLEAVGEGIALRYLAEPEGITPSDFEGVLQVFAEALTRPVSSR